MEAARELVSDYGPLAAREIERRRKRLAARAEVLRAYVADRPLLWGLGFDPPDADPEVVALVSGEG